MLSRIRAKLNALIARAFRQGWSTEKICWSCAWGISIGLFPILGFTMAALAVVGLVFKLNHTLLQGFNYIVGPLKWALILPSVRLGEFMFRSDRPFRLSLAEFRERFQAAPGATLAEFGMTFVHAIAGWMLIAPIALALSYLLMKHILRTGSAARTRLEEIPT